MGTAAHRPGLVLLSPAAAAVALALLFLSSTLRLAVVVGARVVQPYGGGGGPCALAVAPLGYPCEEHQVRLLVCFDLDMTVCMVHRQPSSRSVSSDPNVLHASCPLYLVKRKDKDRKLLRVYP
jgi:hypothetical protein